MNTNITAGLDLGTTKVACLIAKSDDASGFEIIGVGIEESTGLQKGVVVNLERTAESIKVAVAEAEQQAGVKLNEMYANIGGDHIRGTDWRGVSIVSHSEGEITSVDVNNIIEQARATKVDMDREIIHAIPQDFTVDNTSGVEEPIGMSGNRLEANIYIITAAAVSAQNVHKSVDRAGYAVRELVLQPIASANAVLDTDELELGCMLIDIGAGTTDVAIFHDSILRDTFAIGLGGLNITKDISIGLATPRREAERVKMNHGVACQDLASDENLNIPRVGRRDEQPVEKKELASIIEPRIEEIFSLVNRKIRHTGYTEILPAGVILTGGTAKMAGIDKLAERVFNMPAKIGIPNSTNGLNDVVEDPIYATSLGLIIYGLKNTDIKEMGKVSRDHIFKRAGTRVKRWLLE